MTIDLASLIEWALRSSLFLVGVLLLIKCMGHRISASLRHVFLVVGMFGAAAMPLLSVILPDWGVIPATLLEGKNETPPVGLVETNGIAVKPDTSIGESSRVEIVFLVWVLVSIILMFRVLIAMCRVRTLANETDEIVEKGRIYQVLNGLRSRLGIKSIVRLSVGSTDTSPKTVGGICPKIILPEGARIWEREKLELVLMHELAHVKRRDVLIRTFVTLVCAFQWFNPLIWIVRRRIAVESEMACDDLVLKAGHDPLAYSQQLLELSLEVKMAEGPMVGVAAMARPCEIEVRLKSILDENCRRVSSSFGAKIGIASIVVLLVPLAMAGKAQMDLEPQMELASKQIIAPDADEDRSRHDPSIIDASARGPFLRPELMRSSSIKLGEAIRGNINDHIDALRESQLAELR